MRSTRSTRDFGRCKSRSRAPASPAGWTPLRGLPRRPSRTWRRYPRASPDGPFAGQRSLIVGGSRGLGEVTAKIVAAGGGHPVITYRDSQHEAERVAADIRGAGGQCEILRYDALAPAAEQLEGIGAGRLLLLFRDAENIPAQVGAVRAGQDCAAS